ncbi:MAG: hypothetical protein ACREMY_03885, partial [bacterium]
MVDEVPPPEIAAHGHLLYVDVDAHLQVRQGGHRLAFVQFDSDFDNPGVGVGGWIDIEDGRPVNRPAEG